MAFLVNYSLHQELHLRAEELPKHLSTPIQSHEKKKKGKNMALMLHPIGSGPVVYEISPTQSGGIAKVLREKGIETRIPTLPGHCKTVNDLAKVKGEEWLQKAKEEIYNLLNDKEIEEIYLIGYSMGGLLTLLALFELLKSQYFQNERMNRVTVLVINTPVHIQRWPWWLAKGITLLPRKILELIRLPNKPRPNEPNHEYLKQALVTKELPLSSGVEMQKLVWKLVEVFRSQEVEWESLKKIFLLQAIPDGIIHPASVEILRKLIGAKATVITIEDATHGLPEGKAWEAFRDVVDKATG
jgi:esterase/lipase